MKKGITLIGFYGRGNFGDDFMALSLIGALRARGHHDIRVFCDNPSFLRNEDVTIIPRRALSLLKSIATSSTLIQGGGTIFHDSYTGKHRRRYWRNLSLFAVIFLLARIFSTRVMILGSGIGPIEHPVSRAICRVALGLSSIIQTRDIPSYNEAIALVGRRTKVLHGHDLSVLHNHPKGSSVSDTTYTLAISACDLTPFLSGEDSEAPWSALSEAIKSVSTHLDKKLNIRIFSFFTGSGEKNDRNISELLKSKLNEFHVEIHDYHDDPMLLWEQLIKCDSLVATRFHALVAAYLAGQPALPLSYNRKVRDFSAEVGVSPEDLLTLPQSFDKLQWETGLRNLIFAPKSAGSGLLDRRQEMRTAVAGALDGIMGK